MAEENSDEFDEPISEDPDFPDMGESEIFGQIPLPPSEEFPLPREIVESLTDNIEYLAGLGGDLVKQTIAELKPAREIITNYLTQLLPTPPHDKLFGVDGTYYTFFSPLYYYNIIGAVGLGVETFYYHVIKFVSIPSNLINRVCQGLMTYLEFKMMNTILQADPENRILYDGTFLSALTRTNSFYSAQTAHPTNIIWQNPEIIKYIQNTSEMNQAWFNPVLTSERVVAVPKRSASNTFLQTYLMQYANQFSDQAFLSLTLKENEYVHATWRPGSVTSAPIHLAPKHPHRPPDARNVEQFFMNQGFIEVFYKPYPWSRAYKVEIPNYAGLTPALYPSWLQSIHNQIITPDISEPLLLFMADAFCKELVEGSKATADAIENYIISNYLATVPNIAILTRRYRT